MSNTAKGGLTFLWIVASILFIIAIWSGDERWANTAVIPTLGGIGCCVPALLRGAR